jgi:hypothetical protein
MKSFRFLLIGSGLLFCVAPSADARGSWGISIGIGVPGVVYASPPGYYPPPPAYYMPPPVYYAPPPVYYAPPPVIYYGPPAYSVGPAAGVVVYGHRGGHRRPGHRGWR